jgi:hypothetical protein
MTTKMMKRRIINFVSLVPFNLANPRERTTAHRVREGERSRVSSYASTRASQRLHRSGINPERYRIGDCLRGHAIVQIGG